MLSYIFSMVSIASIVTAYILRLFFEKSYDSAETMRRQSVLSEGLNWEIDQIQLDNWYQESGISKINRAKRIQDEDYYSSKKEFGPPRILEMTCESIFYTKFIYKKIVKALAVFLVLLILLIGYILIFSLSLSNPMIEIPLSKIFFLLIPLMVSTDILGWVIRLHRSVVEFSNIEKSLLLQSKNPPISLPEVLRGVMEYNCQVINGIPIPKFLFCIFHDEISVLWKIREKKSIS